MKEWAQHIRLDANDATHEEEEFSKEDAQKLHVRRNVPHLSFEELSYDIAQRGLNMLEAHQVKEREFKAGERDDSVDSNVAVVNDSAVCRDRDAGS